MEKMQVVKKLTNAIISGNDSEEAYYRKVLEGFSAPDKNSVVAKANRRLCSLNSPGYTSHTVLDDLNLLIKGDWGEFEIDTIMMILNREYGVEIDSNIVNMVYALKIIKSTDESYDDWFACNQTILALAGMSPDFTNTIVPTPRQVSEFVVISQKIDGKRDYSIEVKKYFCLVLKYHGVYLPTIALNNIIKDVMPEMVSKEIVEKWPEIYNRYLYVLNGNKFKELGENEIDIQVSRLIVSG